GATWRSTIDVDSDVHEVRAHPNRPGIVMAAAAIGLCTSRDAGATWDLEQDGLHAPFCSAVAFAATTSWCPHQWTTSRHRARSTDDGSMGQVHWLPSPAGCLHGSTV